MKDISQRTVWVGAAAAIAGLLAFFFVQDHRHGWPFSVSRDVGAREGNFLLRRGDRADLDGWPIRRQQT